MKKIIETILKSIENSQEYQDRENYKEFSFFEQYCDDIINNLKVFPKNSDVYIEKCDEQGITIFVSYKSDEECIPIKLTQNGETLDVQSCEIVKLVDCKITINVPANVRKVNINSETGNIHLSHQMLQDLKVDNRTGNVEIEESVLAESNIRMTTGCLLVRKSQCENLSVSSENVNISIDKCFLYDTNIRNKNGNITIKRSQTEIDDQHIKTLSINGRVNVVRRSSVKKADDLNTGGQINLRTDNGNIVLDLTGDEK